MCLLGEPAGSGAVVLVPPWEMGREGGSCLQGVHPGMWGAPRGCGVHPGGVGCTWGRAVCRVWEVPACQQQSFPVLVPAALLAGLGLVPREGKPKPPHRFPASEDRKLPRMGVGLDDL